MSDPNSSGPHPLIDDDEDYDDRGSSQADDPTAVWDEDSLAELGIGLGRPKTQASGKERERDTDPPAPGAPPKGLSWPLVIGLAVVIGGLVFVVVRYVL